MYMHLTEFTDNALRLLIYLGGQKPGPDGRLATIGAIAERYGVSRHHLAKVSCLLASAGLIETSRGRQGGMRLAGAPRDIRLGEVVRCTERGLGQAGAAPAAGQRRGAANERLHQSLALATAAYLAELDRVTLADLLPAGPEHDDAEGLPDWLAPNVWRWQYSALEEGA